MSSAGSPSPEPNLPDLERQPAVDATIAVSCCLIAASIPWLLPFTILESAVSAGAATALAVLFCWRSGLLGGRYRIDRAHWRRDGTWHVHDANDRSYAATLSAATRVWPAILWLHWRTEVGTRRMVLIALHRGDTWRRFTVRLRWQAESRAAPV